jgi:hypothetical protein
MRVERMRMNRLTRGARQMLRRTVHRMYVVCVAEKGDRFEVPKSVFSAAATSSEYRRRGVVVPEARGGTNIWFENDTTSSWYKGTFSDWEAYYIQDADCDEDDEAVWANLEIAAGIRVANRSRQSRGASGGASSDLQEEKTDDDIVIHEIDTGACDDEQNEEEDDTVDSEDESSFDMDTVLAGLRWRDAGGIQHDPRAAKHHMPSAFTAKLNAAIAHH